MAHETDQQSPAHEGSCPPRVLRAGPLAVTLDGGALRWITLGDEELVRGVAVSVRDPDWDTILPTIVSQEVVEHRDSFAAHLRVEHVRGDVDFAWDGRIDGDPDGTIRFAFDGLVRHAFLRARIGLGVVHPRAFAGTPLEITTPWGSFQGSFPLRIATVSTFNNIREIRQPLASGATLRIAFEGELFETEDQRNFGDASFKTYCTPLCLTYPVRVEAGDAIRQSVTISVVLPARSTRRARRRAIEVGDDVLCPLPAIGLGAVGPAVSVPSGAASRLRAAAPDHLRVEVDADGEAVAVARQLADGRQQAAAIGAPIELVLVSDPEGTGIEEALGHAHALGISPARMLVYDRTSQVTTKAGAIELRAAAEVLDLAAAIGGGSWSWFDLLNMKPVPVTLLDLVAFGMSPQAHAVDDATVMENVTTLADQVSSGLAIAAGRPLAIGPVGIAYPFNPWATGPTPPGPDGLPYGLDRRQPTLFGAAWTLGALASLARPGVDAVTLREWAGIAGVIGARQEGVPDRGIAPGAVLPAFHVLADLRGFRGRPSVLPAASPPGLASLALRDGETVRVIVANLRPEATRVSIRLPGSGETTSRFLAEGSLERAAADPDVFRAHVDGRQATGAIALDLSPYAIATLERRA